MEGAADAEPSGDLKSTGIFKLMGILSDHMDIMKSRDAEVEKVISEAETADDLREAKRNALLVETELLKSSWRISVK